MSQTQKNVLIALKAQGAKGTPASGAGATGMRVNPSQGFNLEVNQIADPEVRRDGQSEGDIPGSYFGRGNYVTPLTVAGQLLLLEAALRGTWTAAIPLDESVGSLGALTVGTDTLTAAGGSWITQGVRAGQLLKVANTSQAANHNKWVRVLSVTASIITVPAGTFTASGPEATWDITIAKHLICGVPPVERYFTVEEVYQDIDESKVTVDAKVGGFQLAINADQKIAMTFQLAGRDLNREESGTSPIFTDPVFDTGRKLVLFDGSFRRNGSDLTDFTGFTLDFQLNLQGLAVAGTRISPDVYPDNAKGSANLVETVPNLAQFEAFKAGDLFELFAVAAENETDPADFISFYVGQAQYTGHQNPFGQAGAMTQTLPLSFGVDERGAGYAPSMLVISTSAP